MYEEMMRLLDENSIDKFAKVYREYSQSLTLKQVETITERLEIKVAQQTLINQELEEKLKGLTKMEEQLKSVKESLDKVNENKGK